MCFIKLREGRLADYTPGLPHGNIEEIFANVFFVRGTRRWDFQNMMWQFSRNMVVVREGEHLSIINSVRLDDDGLSSLDVLGRVENLIKIGGLHGVDDSFYKDRYDATYWGLPDMVQEGVQIDRELLPDGKLPISDGSLFIFQTTKVPECILLLERNGGVVIACDALQNWIAPDEFFSDESSAVMTEMGFFQKANIGPVWRQVAEPGGEDFSRLKKLSFRHALCAHGDPLIDTAHQDFCATFHRIFGI